MLHGLKLKDCCPNVGVVFWIHLKHFVIARQSYMVTVVKAISLSPLSPSMVVNCTTLTHLGNL